MAPSKKAVAKVPTKNATEPKPVKMGKGKTEATILAPMFEFSCTATIPTMPYGNIMPTIKAYGQTLEEARALVMPMIEELYATYAEKPRDGSRPAFLGKITEAVKEVTPIVAARPAGLPSQTVAPVTVPNAAQGTTEAWNKTAEGNNVPAAAQAPVEAPLSEFGERAAKMTRLAMTEEAALKVKEQIEKSVKIPAEEKPVLIAAVEAKITDFQSNVW